MPNELINKQSLFSKGKNAHTENSDNTHVSRVAEQTYKQLRLAILSGELPANSRLVESDLADRLNVSRTPVREAISRLVNDLLVKPLPHGGVEVINTLQEYEDIFAIREALEGMAACLAASRMTDKELVQLQEVFKEECNLPLDSYRKRSELNNQFHSCILHASRSKRLIKMIEGFREFFISESTIGRYSKRDTQTALKHHQEIIDALLARNGKLAERLVRKHLAHSKDKIRNKLAP